MVAITYVRCGGKTSYRYDKNGQMIEEKTGDSYHITYSYDKAGNRKTVTNSRGQILRYLSAVCLCPDQPVTAVIGKGRHLSI